MAVSGDSDSCEDENSGRGSEKGLMVYSGSGFDRGSEKELMVVVVVELTEVVSEKGQHYTEV